MVSQNDLKDTYSSTELCQDSSSKSTIYSLHQHFVETDCYLLSYIDYLSFNRLPPDDVEQIRLIFARSQDKSTSSGSGETGIPYSSAQATAIFVFMTYELSMVQQITDSNIVARQELYIEISDKIGNETSWTS